MAKQKRCGEMVTIELDKPVFKKLKDLAKSKNCTSYFLLTDIILEKTREQGLDKTFDIPASLYRELQNAAKQKGRTLTQYIDDLVGTLICGTVVEHEKTL